MYKGTPAQLAVRHSLIAGSITAITAIGGFTYQDVLGHGFNPQQLLTLLIPFVLAQAVTLWHTLLLNPSLPQAEADTVQNLPAEIQALPAAVGGLHAKFDQFLQALPQFLQHTHPAPGQPTIAPQAVAVPRPQQFQPPTAMTNTAAGVGMLPQISVPLAAMPTQQGQ